MLATLWISSVFSFLSVAALPGDSLLEKSFPLFFLPFYFFIPLDFVWLFFDFPRGLPFSPNEADLSVKRPLVRPTRPAFPVISASLSLSAYIIYGLVLFSLQLLRLLLLLLLLHFSLESFNFINFRWLNFSIYFCPQGLVLERVFFFVSLYKSDSFFCLRM